MSTFSQRSQRAGDEPAAPVFILGVDHAAVLRSSTLLGAHPRLSCAPPSRLLADLLGAVERNGDALVHYGLPRQYWLRSVARYFEDIQRQHATREGKARWVHWPVGLPVGLLDRTFPTAQIVHIVGRRHPYRPGSVRATRRAGNRLVPGRYLEVGSEEILARPQSGLRRVLDFLGETWDDGALDTLPAAGLLVDLTVGDGGTGARTSSGPSFQSRSESR